MLKVVKESWDKEKELVLAVHLLLNTMQALLRSVAIVVEVEKEGLVMLVVVVLLVIVVDILLTHALLLILAAMNPLLLMRAALVAVALLKINGKNRE